MGETILLSVFYCLQGSSTSQSKLSSYQGRIYFVQHSVGQIFGWIERFADRNPPVIKEGKIEIEMALIIKLEKYMTFVV